MRKHLLSAALVLLAAAAAASAQEVRHGNGFVPVTARDAHHFHVAHTPQSVEWKPFYEGAEIAVLSGDPSKAGSPYVIRIRHRDGLRVPPHWHPFDEHLTVVSGTWVMGMGEKFDLSAAREFPAGSYLVSPKDVPHYALAKGETVVQLHGVGPFAAYFVNPEDDVFKKSKK